MLAHVLDSYLARRRKEKRKKDYVFQRQFNEKPGNIPGQPGSWGSAKGCDMGV